MTIWALPWVYQYTDFQGFGSDGEWLATDNVIMVSVSGGGACRRDMSSYMECVVSWQKDVESETPVSRRRPRQTQTEVPSRST